MAKKLAKSFFACIISGMTKRYTMCSAHAAFLGLDTLLLRRKAQ